MDKNGLSELRLAYKRTMKPWTETIRAEEIASNYRPLDDGDGAMRTSKNRTRRLKSNRRGMHTGRSRTQANYSATIGN